MSFSKKIESHYQVVAFGELAALKKYAAICSSEWSKNDGLEWDEAENLVELCKKAIRAYSKSRTETKSVLKGIVQYANTHDDWDSGEVAGWPDAILDALKKDNPHPLC